MRCDVCKAWLMIGPHTNGLTCQNCGTLNASPRSTPMRYVCYHCNVEQEWTDEGCTFCGFEHATKPKPPPPIGRDAPQPKVPLPFDSDGRFELTPDAAAVLAAYDKAMKCGLSLGEFCLLNDISEAGE